MQQYRRDKAQGLKGRRSKFSRTHHHRSADIQNPKSQRRTRFSTKPRNKARYGESHADEFCPCAREGHMRPRLRRIPPPRSITLFALSFEVIYRRGLHCHTPYYSRSSNMLALLSMIRIRSRLLDLQSGFSIAPDCAEGLLSLL